MFVTKTIPKENPQTQPQSAISENFRPEGLFAPSEARDLEAKTDELLAAIGALGSASGIYTERVLSRKIAKDRDLCSSTSQPSALTQEIHYYLFHRQITELLQIARLSVWEEIVFELYLDGLPQKQIARILKKSRSMVRRLLTKAKRKLQAAYAQGRYAGWYEVYLSEVNRPAYRHRNH